MAKAPTWGLAKKSAPKSFSVPTTPTGNPNAKGPSIKGSTKPAATKHGNTVTTKPIAGEAANVFPIEGKTTIVPRGGK